jgi:hypothetical protein
MVEIDIKTRVVTDHQENAILAQNKFSNGVCGGGGGSQTYVRLLAFGKNKKFKNKQNIQDINKEN